MLSVPPLCSYISEVSSNVNIFARDGSPYVGGIVGQMGSGNSRVQYSRSQADIEWDPATATTGTALGGIVGYIDPAGANQIAEIRDSYSRASFTIDTTGAQGTGHEVYVGGLLGFMDAPDAGKVPFYFVRNYSVSSLDDGCTLGVGEDCDPGDPRFFGALSGNVDGSDTVWVSNFFKVAGGLDSAVGSTTQPAAYDGSGFPVAAPLSDGFLKSISTYQSKEGNTSNQPSGTANLTIAASDGSAATEADHRWAIEPINVQTFVPSSYDRSDPVADVGTSAEQLNFWNRNLYPDPVSEATYLVKRPDGTTDLTDLDLHAGSDAATADDYPLLGRVWDICDDYPTLVWEEQTNCNNIGGGGSGGSTTTTSALALAAGLTEAEYAAFLASGLTLEQFKAARLAATGPNSSALLWGVSSAVLLMGLGASLLVAFRSRRGIPQS